MHEIWHFAKTINAMVFILRSSTIVMFCNLSELYAHA